MHSITNIVCVHLCVYMHILRVYTYTACIFVLSFLFVITIIVILHTFIRIYTHIQVVQDLADIADKESVVLKTIEQEMALLNTALTFRCDQLDAVESSAVEKAYKGEVDDDEYDQQSSYTQQSRQQGSKSGSSSMAAISSLSLTGSAGAAGAAGYVGASSSSGGGTATTGFGRRKVSALGALSGADGLVYSEQQQQAPKR